MTAPYMQDSIPLGLLQPVRRQAPEHLLLGLLGGTALGDYGTTVAGLHQGLHEGNPLMKPFADHGAIPLALAEAGLTGITSMAAHQLRKDGSKWWWVPPALGILGHGFAIQHNLKAMRR